MGSAEECKQGWENRAEAEIMHGGAWRADPGTGLPSSCPRSKTTPWELSHPHPAWAKPPKPYPPGAPHLIPSQMPTEFHPVV